MNEEKKGVEGEVETPTVPPTENNEQAPVQEETQEPVSEDVKTEEADVENKAAQLANIQKAIEKENEKLRKIREEKKEALNQPVQETEQKPVQSNEPSVEQQFYDNINLTKLNNKMLTDPSFRERADLVKHEMETTGKSLEDADNAVLARVLREAQSEQASNQIQQITPTAEQTSQPQPDSIRGDKAFESVLEGKSPEAKEYKDIMKEVGMPGL